MDPSVILAWAGLVTELADALGRLGLLGRQIGAGEEVTLEQLAAAAQDNEAAVARWKATIGKGTEPAPDSPPEGTDDT